MQKSIAALLALLLLTGCGSHSVPEAAVSPTNSPDAVTAETFGAAVPGKETAVEIPYVSRFDTVTEITLSDDGMLFADSDAIGFTNDIIYYEDRETYDSGNPYGEGAAEERHTAEEAAAHQVVNITKPGAYRVTGTLSQGQIRVDLGKDAQEDPDAVVELILEDAKITCTVAPAILFLNVYECDEDASEETASPEVDTTSAGANLILEGNNVVNGSHVAKIFKDKEEEKKLWKQDGAIYSYQSMNVFGPGTLELTADNEGLDTEMHLTINSGNISIYSQNDGINTNEDGVSVTTINGGKLMIFAGLGEEGDGIDSNGYLVINGGNVTAAANPKADAGLDSDLGSYIHGGTVVAMGSTMDWAESDSRQVTMNLQFANQQKAGSKIVIMKQDGTQIFSFESDSEYARGFSGLILSHPYFQQGETYHVYVDGIQMSYTGIDVRRGPGGFGGDPGGMPGDFAPENLPEGFDPSQMPGDFEPGRISEKFNSENMPEDFDPSRMGGRGQRPGTMTPPEGFDREMPQMPEDGFGSRGGFAVSGKTSTDFYMNDKVNAFSGVMDTAEATA